ncbi:TonB-dependent siderophore receptor [Puniceicoccaceae bacterium K14]|nr:TonB-dependent siderophore receptor [Puniceicoccaceae bacterium K14]
MNNLNKLILLSLGTLATSTMAQNTNSVHLDGVTLTGDESFFELEPSINSKLTLPINETPRSIQAISQEEFKRFGALSVQDTLSYTAGVYTAPFGVDSRLDDSQIRGLDPLSFLDGFQSHVGFYNTTRPDIYTVESVEVVKGPSSVLYGQGAIGGIVNVNSKLPQAKAHREINLQYGSFDRSQLGLDFTGSINDDSTFLYRFVGVLREGGTQVDYVDNETKVLMPSVTWQPTKDTSLTFLGLVQENDGGSTIQFLPLNEPSAADLDVGSETFTGEPNWDRYNTEQTAISQFFDHKFNKAFSISINSRYSQGGADYAYHQVIPTPIVAGVNQLLPFFGLPTLDLNLPNGTYHRFGYISKASLDMFSANASGKLELENDSVKHTIQFGVDLIDGSRDDDRPNLVPGFRGYFPTFTVVNLENPTFSGVPQFIPEIEDAAEFEFEHFGIYISDTIEIDNFIISLAARNDSIDESFTDGTGVASNDEISLDGGIIYNFENGFSPYFSYAESFQSNGADSNTGEIFDPRTGTQYELGVKYLSRDNKTLATLALFDIDEQNRLVGTTDPTQIDADYQGVELELRHNVKDYFIQASVTFADAKQASPDEEEERVVPHYPESFASLWLGYNPSQGVLENFNAGLGVRHADKVYSLSNRSETNGYTVADLMLSYHMENWKIQLNASNLFDKEYIASVSDDLLPVASFGARRAITFSASYNF